MRDQQRNGPAGVKMRQGESHFHGGTNGAVYDISSLEIRRGWSSESCGDDYSFNSYAAEAGGFLGRPHGTER